MLVNVVLARVVAIAPVSRLGTSLVEAVAHFCAPPLQFRLLLLVRSLPVIKGAMVASFDHIQCVSTPMEASYG